MSFTRDLPLPNVKTVERDGRTPCRQVCNTYRAALAEEQYQELWRLYSGGRFVNSEATRSLMQNLSLLEYDGDDAWWSIHPITRPLLEERADEFRKTG